MNDTGKVRVVPHLTVCCLVLFVAWVMLFSGCVKGQSVLAASELGKNVSKQYEPSRLLGLCTYYNDKIVPRLEDSDASVVWNCEILDGFNDNIEAVSQVLKSYSTELIKALKVKKNEKETVEQIQELFVILSSDELTQLSDDGESKAKALDAIANAMNVVTKAVFSSLRAGKVAEAIENASGPVNDLCSIPRTEIDKLIENDLAWDKGTPNDSSPRRGLRTKKIQAAIMKDIQKNDCELSVSPANLSCENACTEDMKSACTEFTKRQSRVVQSLLRYQAALEAFQMAHASLEEKSSTLKSLVKDATKDAELRGKIIADAKVVYKSASKLIDVYKN